MRPRLQHAARTCQCLLSLPNNLSWFHLTSSQGLTLPKDLSCLVDDVRQHGEDRVVLRDCSLVGDMAPFAVFKSHKHLKRFDISGNKFHGEVPEEIFDVLCHAQKFQLGGNQLSQATLVSHLALNYSNLRDVRHLDLRDRGKDVVRMNREQLDFV